MDRIRTQLEDALRELLDTAALRPGALFVVGCSSSEILGGHIGRRSSPETGALVAQVVMAELAARGLRLAAQCCEHLNRALIVERETAEALGCEIVSVRPRPKAGGSFAAAVYEAMRDPVAVEQVRADAGIDIGGTLIGMHLRAVAVPVRLRVQRVGEAPVLAARTRPKLIGGARAEYPIV